MVKGVSRQVIVVRPPDTKLFEQAIFSCRDGADGGISDEALLRQARQAAGQYLPGEPHAPPPHSPAKPRLGASRRRRHRPRLAALRSLKQNHRSRPVVLLIAIMR